MIETSVIIPTHNRLDHLKEAVDSVFAQTYRDFELLIVDDGSQDGTGEYLAEMDRPVVALRQERKGVSAARNFGISKCSGRFITFLDSDDLWKPDKLDRQIELLKERPDTMVCYTDEIWIRRGVRVNPRLRHKKYSGWIFEKCLPLCIVSPSSVLMRREFFSKVGYFDEKMPVCEDYDLWLRASLLFPFHFIEQPLIVKRGGHRDQLSAGWGQDAYRVYSLQKLLNNSALSRQQRPLVLTRLVEKCEILGNGFNKRRGHEEGKRYLDMAESFKQELASPGL